MAKLNVYFYRDPIAAAPSQVTNPGFFETAEISFIKEILLDASLDLLLSVSQKIRTFKLYMLWRRKEYC